MKKPEEMEKSHEDIRQRRTRRFLTDALLALMEERRMDDISVVDICERAMVHRTTFYAHFEDKQALLRYAVSVLQQEFEQGNAACATATGPKEYFLALFHQLLCFIRAHRGIYRTDSSGMELRLLEDAVADALCRKLSEPGFLSYSPDFMPEICAHFYAGAILSLLRWWMDNGASTSDEVLMTHLKYFIPLPDTAMERGG